MELEVTMANFMNIGSVICELLRSDGETDTAKLVTPLCKRDEKESNKTCKIQLSRYFVLRISS